MFHMEEDLASPRKEVWSRSAEKNVFKQLLVCNSNERQEEGLARNCSEGRSVIHRDGRFG